LKTRTRPPLLRSPGWALRLGVKQQSRGRIEGYCGIFWMTVMEGLHSCTKQQTISIEPWNRAVLTCQVVRSEVKLNEVTELSELWRDGAWKCCQKEVQGMCEMHGLKNDLTRPADSQLVSTQFHKKQSLALQHLSEYPRPAASCKRKISSDERWKHSRKSGETLTIWLNCRKPIHAPPRARPAAHSLSKSLRKAKALCAS